MPPLCCTQPLFLAPAQPRGDVGEHENGNHRDEGRLPGPIREDRGGKHEAGGNDSASEGPTAGGSAQIEHNKAE